MKAHLSVFLLVSVLSMGTVLAHDQGNGNGEAPRKGYVLKPGEGEPSPPGIIKASPRSGTQGSVMVYDEMPEGSTSGLHYHVKADEFFYVLKGRGQSGWARKTSRLDPATRFSSRLEQITGLHQARTTG